MAPTWRLLRARRRGGGGEGMTAERRHRAELFRRAGGEQLAVCYLGHRGNCRGRLQAEHCISRQRLKDEWHWARRDRSSPLYVITLEDLIANADNGAIACEVAHHHNPHLTVDRDELPGRVPLFAEKFGLEWSLFRDYPERMAVAA